MIEAIRAKFVAGRFEFSRHATDQSIRRNITVMEVRAAMDAAELIEDYPDDKYGPSCLLLGFTLTERPLHVHCSHPTRPVLKVITLYEPDPALWVRHRTRRKPHE